jgi:tetratricopeptide (TPR) repeat protein
MSRGVRRPSLSLLAALLLLGGALLLGSDAARAQAFGRISLIVTDDDGNPLEGVDVVVTCKELNKFHVEEKTNKKGRVTVSVTDATKVYDFHIEHGAYPPVDLPIKPELRGTHTQEVVLTKRGAAPPPGAGEGEVLYTPAERVFNEGVRALQAEDWQTAKVKFVDALKLDPDMKAAQSALARLYVYLEEYEAALAAADRLQALDHEDRDVYRVRYEAHKALGHSEEAATALKELSSRDSGGDTVAMIYNEGVAAVNTGDFVAAKARFQEALEMDPNLVPALGAMAMIYMREGNAAEAAAMAERHLALDPSNLPSLRVRWDAYRTLGDTAKAEEAKKALVAANPEILVKELFDKALETFNAGDTAGSIAKFEEVLTLDPDHPRAHYHLGIGYVSSGDTAAAKKHLERFIELAPDDPEAQTAKDMLGYLN